MLYENMLIAIEFLTIKLLQAISPHNQTVELILCDFWSIGSTGYLWFELSKFFNSVLDVRLFTCLTWIRFCGGQLQLGTVEFTIKILSCASSNCCASIESKLSNGTCYEKPEFPKLLYCIVQCLLSNVRRVVGSRPRNALACFDFCRVLVHSSHLGIVVLYEPKSAWRRLAIYLLASLSDAVTELDAFWMELKPATFHWAGWHRQAWSCVQFAPADCRVPFLPIFTLTLSTLQGSKKPVTQEL